MTRKKPKREARNEPVRTSLAFNEPKGNEELNHSPDGKEAIEQGIGIGASEMITSQGDDFAFGQSLLVDLCAIN